MEDRSHIQLQEEKEWKDLVWWQCGEYQVIQEHLKDMDIAKHSYNPPKHRIFKALDATPYNTVQVAILGQDPYPSKSHCTGIAFSIPKDEKVFPPTLVNIFREYNDDLHYPNPHNGDLTKWCKQGVLLWNVTPTCDTGKPGSHSHWPEWHFMNKEILEWLNLRRVVLVCLGNRARAFAEHAPDCRVLAYSHPSPLGANKTSHPFLGSRMFSNINAELVKLGREPINWRL